MGYNRYIGQAVAIAQVDRFTPANVEIGDIFTLIVTGTDKSTHKIQFIATAATVANVTAGLVAAWNASTNSLCTGITAADETTAMTLTADVAGTGFTVTATAVNGGSTDDQTLTRSVVTANSGPMQWDCADNWSAGEVPGTSVDDDVIVDGAEIYWGLDQTGIVNDLNSLTINNSIIGDDPVDGQVPFYLEIDSLYVYIGKEGGHSTVAQVGPINLNNQKAGAIVQVYNTRRSDPLPGLRLILNSATASLNAIKGRIDVAAIGGETAVIGDVYINYLTSIDNDASVLIGPGCTTTNIYKYGGSLKMYGLGTNLYNFAGNGIINTSDGFSVVECVSGILTVYRSGDMVVVHAYGGHIDAGPALDGFAMTGVLFKNGQLTYDPDIVTVTFGTQPGKISLIGNYRE